MEKKIAILFDRYSDDAERNSYQVLVRDFDRSNYNFRFTSWRHGGDVNSLDLWRGRDSKKKT